MYKVDVCFSDIQPVFLPSGELIPAYIDCLLTYFLTYLLP